MISYLKRGLEAEVTTESLACALAEIDSSVPEEDVARLAATMAEVVWSIPDAIEQVLAMSKDERCGRAISFAVGSILKYLVDPDDLIAESEYGNIGLLDDAYLVHTFAAQLALLYPHAIGNSAYVAPSQRTLDTVAALLPDGVAPSLERTCDAVIMVAQALFVAGANEVPPTAEHTLRLRVAAAVDAIDVVAAEG